MRKSIIAGAVALMCAAGAAGAQDANTISAQQAVQARRAGMFMSGALTASMKAGIDANASPRAQVFAAGTLARWAAAMPGLFPAGSGMAEIADGSTKAKAEIWTARADFEAKAADLAAATTRLQELARAEDAAGFATQWTAVRASCQACHDVYKAS